MHLESPTPESLIEDSHRHLAELEAAPDLGRPLNHLRFAAVLGLHRALVRAQAFVGNPQDAAEPGTVRL